MGTRQMITIGIPVLARPHRAAKVYATIVENTTVPFEVIWVVSPGDREQHIACMATPHTTVAHATWQAGPADFARKHALAFELSRGDWYFAGADDLEFMAGWDTEALAVAEETGAKVIGTNDLANPTVMRGEHATHILFDADYVREVGATWHDGPGAVYSTAYDHQYVDNEAVACARDRGVWAFAERSHVKHHHPIFDGSPMDATYRKALAEGNADRRVFMQRQALARRLARR